MLEFIAILFVFSTIILIHEFGHFIMAKKCGVRVERFSLGFGPELLGVKKGDTRYSISLILFGGYVKMAGDDPAGGLTGKSWEYLSQPVSKRLSIVAAGPVLNYILAFLVFFLVFVIGSPTPTSRIGDLLEDYPARAHNLMQGDKIIAVDGKEVKYWNGLTEIIHNSLEGSLLLTIQREDRFFKVRIFPKIEEIKNIWGQPVKTAFIGIRPSDEIAMLRYNPFVAFYKAGERLFLLSALTLRGLGAVVTGQLSFRESVAGPIKIAAIIGKTAKLGVVYLFSLMGVISMALAIFNILPIPVLDGGHVVFLILEKIRKKPLRLKTQESIQNIAMTVLIILALFVSYNDIMGLMGK
ncbi:MAG: RIP metalloprotease RseP [Candidatus Omnitrophota bacterium]|nr:RIP metalloprotease RseP [Candidatus Omnitrophota bacterium]